MSSFHRYRYVTLGALFLVIGTIGLVAHGILQAHHEAVLYLGLVVLGVLILGRGADVSYAEGREAEARETLRKLVDHANRDA
jgi:hypothetical protein